MPDDLTLFAAQHLMTVDAALAAVVVLGLLYRRRHATVVWWTITSALMLTLSLLFSRIGSALYTDPRPFVVGHFQPLLPHTANNRFPSGYGVLAAAIVAAVFLVSRRWAIPFMIFAILIDWARVGVGFHHVTDIVGSWVFVTLATAIAIVPGALIAAILLPSIPPSWSAERLRLGAAGQQQGYLKTSKDTAN